MAAPDAIITSGTLSAADLEDETNLLVSACTITPTRTKKEYGRADSATAAVQHRNPQLKLDFTAQISVETGLAIQGPGTEITSLANYAGTLHTFDPAVGTIIYEDPVRDLSQADSPALKFSAVHYPFVT